jgi:hypothetical protein
MKKGLMALALFLSSPNLLAASNLELMAKWIPVAIKTCSELFPKTAASTVAIKVIYMGPVDQVDVIFVMGDKSSLALECTEHMPGMEGFPHCMEMPKR